MRFYFRSTSWIMALIVCVSVILLPSYVRAQQSRRGAAARKTQKRVPMVRFASGKSTLKIPLELDGNIILLRVRVNNSKPLKFNFDTGATGEDVCKMLKVERVDENSPASEAGLQAGDIITAIDGKLADSISSTELDRLFR
jgi:membrane-associated protease RseP (regulator of RpoE activity)